MSKTLRTNFDRQEKRRDRRYPLAQVVVAIGDAEYVTINWSLGGFLLADGPALALGTVVQGAVRLPPQAETHDFTAEVVRRDEEPKGTAFRFVERSPRLVDALDGALARRMSGHRPG